MCQSCLDPRECDCEFVYNHILGSYIWCLYRILGGIIETLELENLWSHVSGSCLDPCDRECVYILGLPAGVYIASLEEIRSHRRPAWDHPSTFVVTDLSFDLLHCGFAVFTMWRNALLTFCETVDLRQLLPWFGERRTTERAMTGGGGVDRKIAPNFGKISCLLWKFHISGRLWDEIGARRCGGR